MLSSMLFGQSIFFKSLQFWAEALRQPSAQTWDNDSNTVILKTPHYKLRLFLGKGQRQEKCCFAFPPHAGRSPKVIDNLIKTCQEEGFDVYVFELLAATRQTGNINLENLIDFATTCYDHIKQEKILLGVCQGFWLSILVAHRAAQKPIAQFGFAGPADFSAGDGHIKQMCQKIPYGYMELIVTMSGGIQPGLAQWWNFTLRDPGAIFQDDFLKLWDLILEGKDTVEWHRNHDWTWSPQHLPGPMFLEIFKLLFTENRLKEMVDFKKFDWLLFLFAGKDDEITLPEQTFAMANWVSSSSFIRKYLFDNCGHTATFCKKEPLFQVTKDLQQLVSGGYALV